MDEADRIRDAYARRAERGADERYALSEPANRYLFERRERALLSLLRRHGLRALAGMRIIDVGCGSGDVLRDFVRFGAEPGLLAGVDLLPDRIASARTQGPPAVDFREGEASSLPFRDGTFDMALQFTLMSSVFDDQTRRRIARETMRVLRSGGVLVWYDFVWNPLNSDVRGVTAREIRALYSGCGVDARRVTLAPPVSRVLARVSFRACRVLEAVPVFRSHILAAVRKPKEAGEV